MVALSVLVMLAHVLPVTGALQGLLDRLFMLLAIPILLLLLQGRGLFLSPLRPLLSASWLRVTERLYLALIVTLLASAALGVAGYVNLAGSIAAHIGWLLLVSLGWLLLRGLARDAFGRSKDYITQYHPALDWTQPLLISAERLSQIVLFVLAVWVVFQVYGWDAQSAPARTLSRALFFPLFELDDRPLTVMSLLVTAVILIVVMRFARWSRDATYRWLFTRIANTSARHSLSVFTQYLVVLVGLLIALRVLGIDLTTLTVFAGALGVGMGLGLQSIANNFISGVLLLLERPLRTGDTVTIGNNEGAVTHIGLRSLTVKTWDNQEVIIPNSEVISHRLPTGPIATTSCAPHSRSAFIIRTISIRPTRSSRRHSKGIPRYSRNRRPRCGWMRWAPRRSHSASSISPICALPTGRRSSPTSCF